MIDYYQFLNVSNQASSQEIKYAYRKLAQKFHPDRYKAHDAEDKMKFLNEIKDILLSEIKRSEYDEQLRSFITFKKRQESQYSSKSQGEKFSREKAEHDAREDAKKSAREKAEHDAREDAKKSAREKAEHDAREDAKKSAKDNKHIFLSSLFIIFLFVIIGSYLKLTSSNTSVQQLEEISVEGNQEIGEDNFIEENQEIEEDNFIEENQQIKERPNIIDQQNTFNEEPNLKEKEPVKQNNLKEKEPVKQDNLKEKEPVKQNNLKEKELIKQDNLKEKELIKQDNLKEKESEKLSISNEDFFS